MTLKDLKFKYEHLLFYLYIPISLAISLLIVKGIRVPIDFSFLSLLFLFIYLLIAIKDIKLDKNYLIIIVFILYVFILTSFHYITNDIVDNRGRSLAIFHYKLYSTYLVSYLYGRYSRFNLGYMSYIWLAILTLLIYYTTDATAFSINREFLEEEEKGIYLTLGNLFSIFLIYIISSTNNTKYRFLLFLLGTVALFILNSRSSLYAFIIIFVIYFVLYSDIKKLAFGIILFSGITLAFFSSSYFDYLLEANPRMLAIINGIDSDGSKIARDHLLEVGLKRTLDSPFTGDYGGVIKEFNSLGSYIHNILSYWQSFGLLPFLIIIFLFIVQPLYIAKKAYNDRLNFNSAVYFNIALYLILLSIISKSYTWHYSWFFVGLLHSYPDFLNNRSISASKYSCYRD